MPDRIRRPEEIQRDTFLEYMRRERRASPHTVKAYRDDLRQFGEFFNQLPNHESRSYARSSVLSSIGVSRDGALQGRLHASNHSFAFSTARVN